MKSLRYYFRYVIRNKVFSIVTISSLAVSMSIIILLSAFIISEFKYDYDLKDIDKIFRIGDSNSSPLVPEKAKDLFISEIPEVLSATNYGRMLDEVVYNGKNISAQIIHTDENFFSIFNINFLIGDYQGIFEDPLNVVITESLSKRIFGNENPIGKILNISHSKDVKVAAIIDDFPDKSVLSGDLLCSTKLRIKYSADCVDPNNCTYFYNTLLKLNSLTPPSGIQDKLTSIITGVYSSKFNKDKKLTYFLLPYKKVYFDTSLTEDDLSHANINLIKLLILLTSILLALSIFNFINLSISQITSRFKEFGIKKVFGATSLKIFAQFLTEAFFTMLLAFVIGLILSVVFEPSFNKILGKQIDIQEVIGSPLILVYSLFSLLLLAFVSAIYPALVTLRFQPKEIMTTEKINFRNSLNLRNILNLLQYTASITVIIALLVITLQLNFVKHKDLGFNTEYLLRIPLHYKTMGKVDILNEKIRTISGVKNVCNSIGTPGQILTSGRSDMLGEVSMITSNSDFVETFGLHILEGRNFLPQEKTSVCLINKKAMQQAGWTDITGQKMFGKEVVGLVEDFYFKDLYNDLGCLMIANGTSASHITVRLNSGDISNSIAQLKEIFTEVLPGYGFNYQFYDDYFNSLYKQEEKRASAILIIAFITIFITCIGLFGSVEFSTLNRSKEIGIRRVNGAQVFEVMVLLNKNFARLVIIAFIVACPIAYYILNMWLGNFKYKISLEWWIFAVSCFSMILIALATTSWRTWKTATTNPIEALRYE